MSEKNNSGSNLLAFLLGLGIGALLGILFAPAEGKETRKKIAKYLEELEEKGEEYLGKGKEFIEEEAGKVKKFIEESKEKIAKKFTKESSEE
ncbi:MAG: YtxH domain-containing protein [Endomicrobia bacterium]|nr:YtxH domain-containing protein [Endomicrobiia bacterium]